MEHLTTIVVIIFAILAVITLAIFSRLSDISNDVREVSYKLEQLRMHIFRKDSKQDLEEWRWQDGEPPPWQSETENDLPEV